MSTAVVPMIVNHLTFDVRPVEGQRVTFTRCTINGTTATDDSRGNVGIVATRDMFAPDPVRINDIVKIRFGHSCDLG